MQYKDRVTRSVAIAQVNMAPMTDQGAAFEVLRGKG